MLGREWGRGRGGEVVNSETGTPCTLLRVPTLRTMAFPPLASFAALDAPWLHAPAGAEWDAAAGRLTLRTKPDTDFWRKTHYNFVRDSGHFCGFAVQGNFEVETCFEGEYTHLYDQAGLVRERRTARSRSQGEMVRPSRGLLPSSSPTPFLPSSLSRDRCCAWTTRTGSRRVLSLSTACSRRVWWSRAASATGASSLCRGLLVASGCVSAATATASRSSTNSATTNPGR